MQFQVKTTIGGMIAALLFVSVFFSPPARAALPAYIDVGNNEIVGRGEARPAGNSQADMDAARSRAIQDAKQNIRKILLRQPIDPRSMELRTVGEFIKDNPAKAVILDDFVNSAGVSDRGGHEGDTIGVIVTLPVDGPDGFKVMLARLMGRVISPKGAKPGKPAGTGGENPGGPGTKPAHAQSPALSSTPGTYRIALLEFRNLSGHDNPNPAAVLTARLRERFQRDPRMTMLKRDAANDVLAMNNRTAADLWDSEAGDTISLHGAEGLVIGAVTRYEPMVEKHGVGGTGYLETSFSVEVDLRVLDARTGKWVFFDTVSASQADRTFTLKNADDADRFIRADNLDDRDGLAARVFDEAVRKVESAIRVSFPLEGYVLKVIGDRVYINLARADGVRVGDSLEVYRLGEMLEDPVTGDEVGRIRRRIGSLSVTEVSGDYSQTVTSGPFEAPVNPGDVVVVTYGQ